MLVVRPHVVRYESQIVDTHFLTNFRNIGENSCRGVRVLAANGFDSQMHLFGINNTLRIPFTLYIFSTTR
jgi:hypothetical protein